MEEGFERLRKQLELQEWPAVYFFKFIVPNKPELLARVTALFDASAEMAMHPSKNNNYMSISAKEMMMSADSIMEKYVQASQIPGIISL